jgi:hypothetical protein
MKANRGFGIAALVALATCGGLDTFSITETQRTVIQGSPLPDVLGLVTFTGFNQMDISSNEELQNQGVERHQIDSVRLTRLTMQLVEPGPNQDFTFIDSIAFFVESAGLEKKRIASGGPFPADATSVELALDDVDLGPYAAAESMSITTEAEGEAPPENRTIEATIALDVDVNVEGALCGE